MTESRPRIVGPHAASNENGLIRFYVGNSTNLAADNPADLRAIETRIESPVPQGPLRPGTWGARWLHRPTRRRTCPSPAFVSEFVPCWVAAARSRMRSSMRRPCRHKQRSVSAGCSHERSRDESVRSSFAFEVIAEVGMGERDHRLGPLGYRLALCGGRTRHGDRRTHATCRRFVGDPPRPRLVGPDLETGTPAAAARFSFPTDPIALPSSAPLKPLSSRSATAGGRRSCTPSPGTTSSSQVPRSPVNCSKMELASGSRRAGRTQRVTGWVCSISCSGTITRQSAT